MMSASAKKRLGKDSDEARASPKQDSQIEGDSKTGKKIQELKETLAQVKADLNQEQKIVLNAVKNKTSETRVSENCVVKEIEGISEIFENYFRIFDEKQNIEEEYYALKRAQKGSRGNEGKRENGLT